VGLVREAVDFACGCYIDAMVTPEQDVVAGERKAEVGRRKSMDKKRQAAIRGGSAGWIGQVNVARLTPFRLHDGEAAVGRAEAKIGPESNLQSTTQAYAVHGGYDRDGKLPPCVTHTLHQVGQVAFRAVQQ